MKILHLNYSDTDGGAAIAVKRLHDILNQNNIDSYLLVSEKKYNHEKILNIQKKYYYLVKIQKTKINLLLI